MKRNFVALLILLSIAFSGLMAWDLDRQCDFPANFYGMEVVGNEAWAVGTGGAVTHSVDSGETFVFVPTPAFNPDIQHYIDVSGVSFKDVDNGIICGEEGFAAITNDNGVNWTILTEVTSLAEGNHVEKALYHESGKIWLVGVYGKVLFSPDNGESWTIQTTDVEQWIYGISMDINGLGYISGNNGSDDLAFLMKTTNFGETWIRITTEIEGNPHLFDIKHFGDTVVISGEDGYLGVSTDGASSFTTISVDSVTDDLRYISMNGDIGYAVGFHGAVINTTDSWASVSHVENNYCDYFEEVRFTSEGDLLSVGWRGNIIKSYDGGFTWNEQAIPATYLLGGSIIDEDTWYICGDYAYLLKTTNGGQSYHKINVPYATDKFYDCHFFNEEVGIVSGDNDGVIFRTENGGDSWSSIEVPGADKIYKFNFLNDLIGFGFSSANDCIKTIDGGINWTVLDNGPTSSVYSGYMKNEMDILAGGSGSSGNIWTSTDGGANWNRFSIGIKRVMDFAFKDENIGVAVTRDGFIYYTTTGGMTANDWTVAEQVTTEHINGLTIDHNNNFVACTYSESEANIVPSNVILVSEDNGVTWIEEEVPATTFNPIRLFGIMSANGRRITYGGFQVIYSDMEVTEAPAVFFSEYIEGSSNNKALEIYNGTESDIDLSDYAVARYNNGSTDDENLTILAGTLTVGDVYVIANVDAVEEILVHADTTSNATWFNGNDYLGLVYDANNDNVYDNATEVIDVIGVLGENPGTAWSVAGVDDATKEHTLVRKSTVITGNTDWTASAGTTTDDSEWIVYDQDTFDYIGSHNVPIIEGTISGTVTLIGGDGAVIDVEINIGDETLNPAADGTFSLTIDVGTYEFSAFLEGYTPFPPIDVVVTDGENTIVDIILDFIVEDLNPPTNLNVNEVTAVMTWSVPDVSSTVNLEEGFETWPPTGWSFIDADDDGYQWDDGGTVDLDAHTGEGVAYSASFINDTGALTPDNWLISPAVEVGANSSVNYWVCAQDNDWAAEHYGVYLSTTGTNIDDFELLFEETMVGRNDSLKDGTLKDGALKDGTLKDGTLFVEPRGSREQGAWYERTVNLADSPGTYYIAFRHFNVTNMFYLNLDDVTISSDTASRKLERDLIGYKVFLDNVEVADVTATSHTFTNLTAGTTYEAGVKAVYDGGLSEMVSINFTYTPVSGDNPAIVAVTALGGNYPNPFNPTTIISFSLKENGNVTLEVFNTKGQKIRTLVNSKMQADNYKVTWNGNDDNGDKVSSGIYFYKMKTSNYIETKKMLMLK